MLNKKNSLLKKITLFQLLVYLFIIGSVFQTIIPRSDPDSYWHIKTGEYIVEKGEVPHYDPFSFTGIGLQLKWVAHEWLSDVLFYLFASWGQERALSLLKLMIACGVLFFLYKIIVLRMQNKQASALISSISLFFLGPFFVVRPQLFTYLLLVILIYVLEKRAAGLGHRYSLLWIPFLFTLWVNLHGGAYIIGFVVIFFYFLFGRGNRREWVGLLGISLPFVMLNPYHVHMIFYPFEVMGNSIMVNSIQEWLSPDFHGWSGRLVLFEIFLGLILLVFSPEQKRPMDITLIFFFLFMALSSRRHVTLYFLVSPIYLAPYIMAKVQSLGNKPSLRTLFSYPDKRYAILAFMASLLFSMIVVSTLLNTSELAVDEKQYPVKAVEWMKKQGIKGNILNEYMWGGYLIQQLSPECKVFIDGRADIFLPLYNDSRIYEDNLDFTSGKLSIEEMTRRYPIDYALYPSDFFLNHYLKNEDGWTKIWEDQTSVLWKRN